MKALFRIIRRTFAAIAVVLLVLAVAGASYEAIGERIDASKYPAPGQTVTIDRENELPAHKLHVNCTGTQVDGKPTIVLDALSGGSSVYWGWVQPELARSTRVCSYDRPGFGWSEAVDPPPGLSQVARDLHSALLAAGTPGPYIMVGHSIGGLYVRQFAQLFPQDVAGIVLLDAAHPLQNERHPELAAQDAAMLKWMPFIQLAARLGVIRGFFALGGEIDFKDLPAQPHDALASFWSSPRHWESERGELAASAARFSQAHDLGGLGSLPLAVITAGGNTAVDWAKNQAELAALSTNSSHVVIADATHASLVFSRSHALQVCAVILKVWGAGATGGRL